MFIIATILLHMQMQIQRISATTTNNNNLIKTVAGTGSASHLDGYALGSAWLHPYGIAVDRNKTIYIADSGNHRVRIIYLYQDSTVARVSTLAGGGSVGSNDGVGSAASFYFPQAVAVDATSLSAGTVVYVADTKNHLVRKVTAAGGIVTTVAGTAGVPGAVDGDALTVARFKFPMGIAVDSSGVVYVCDSGNNVIRKISGSVVSTFAGSGSLGSSNGESTAASFSAPWGLVFDSSASLIYVADTGNNLVRRITSSGTVTTLAGSGASGSTDGTGTSASFSYPAALAVDTSGNLYVADAHNEKIRYVTSAGVTSTFAGNGSIGRVDSLLLAATFYNPLGIAVDGDNRVYIADSWNHKIRATASSASSAPFNNINLMFSSIFLAAFLL